MLSYWKSVAEASVEVRQFLIISVDACYLQLKVEAWSLDKTLLPQPYVYACVHQRIS
jgi:hypothetical protein